MACYNLKRYVYRYLFSDTDPRTKPIQLRFIHRGSTERYSYTPSKQPPSTSSSFLQPVATPQQQSQQHLPRSPCSPKFPGLTVSRSHSQRRGSSPQAPPQILYGAFALKGPNSAQSSPPGPRSPRLGGLSDPWNSTHLKIRRSSGEMEWLTAPGHPRSRKNSWSSVSTDFDFSPCW